MLEYSNSFQLLIVYICSIYQSFQDMEE